MAERLYCGNKTPVPEGYAGYDTRLNCLRRGVGVGLYRRGTLSAPQANKKQPTFFQRVPLFIWILLGALVVTSIVLLILYIIK